MLSAYKEIQEKHKIEDEPGVMFKAMTGIIIHETIREYAEVICPTELLKNTAI